MLYIVVNLCAVFKNNLTNPIPIFELLDKYSRPKQLESLVYNINHLDYDTNVNVINKILRKDTREILKMYINLIEFEPEPKRKDFIEIKFKKNIQFSIEKIKKDIPDSYLKFHIIQCFEILINAIKKRNIYHLETYLFVDKSFKLNLSNQIQFKEIVFDLWSSLRRAKLIDKKTKKTQIKKLLTNTPLPDKIIWTGELQQFKFFIDILVNHPKIEDVKNNKWIIALNCFHVTDRIGNVASNQKVSNQKKPTLSKQKKIKTYLNF